MKHSLAALIFVILLPMQRAFAQEAVLPLAPRTPLEIYIASIAGAIFVAAMVFALWRSKRETKKDEDDAELKIDLHALPLPLAALDDDARLIETNAAWNELFGLNESAPKELRLSQLLHPAEVEGERTRFNALQDNPRREYQTEARFYRGDEELLQGRLTVASLGLNRRLPEDATRVFAIARVEDLTRAHRAEADSLAARAALHELYAVVVEDGQALDTRLHSMLEMGCRRFGVETGIVGRAREDCFEIIQVISPDERLRRGQTHSLQSESDGKVSVVAGALEQIKKSDAQSHRAITERETYLGAPIRVLGRLHGVLAFASVEPRDKPFESSDIEVLELMAGWLGGELERTQSRRQLEIKSRQLEAQQKELLEANARLEELATRDGLTGAHNRRFLDERLDEEIARARRYKTPLSFLMLDVDKFKQYNDSFGHIAGDEALQMVAKVLKANVRSIDLVARYGGEEFAVVLPNTDAAGARILADRLRHAIEVAPWTERAVTASFGAATLQESMKDRSPFTAAADAALYHSKEAGRNRVTHNEDI